MTFDQAFDGFVEAQRKEASGQRLAQLHRDLTGTRKLLEVLWPVFCSFDGMILEFEMTTGPGGTKIYVDVLYEPLRWALEAEGFVPHAEKIDRSRFDFEKRRVRALAAQGFCYLPFTWDELDQRPEQCRQSVYELLGRATGSAAELAGSLSPYEREVIRQARRLVRPFGYQQAGDWLQVSHVTARKTLRSLAEKRLIRPTGKGRVRCYEYQLEETAKLLLL